MISKLSIVKSNANPQKDYINLNRLAEPRHGVLFCDFIETIVEMKIRTYGIKYRRRQKALIDHLNSFAKAMDATLYTNSINQESLGDFLAYLQNLNLKKGYIKGLMGTVKYFIRLAGSQGYSVDPSYEFISVEGEQTSSIYLSTNDITRIYYFKGLSKKQSDIRDLFVVGCLTALRYSDYSTLTKDNFKGDYIVKVTKKTNKKVIIPIHDFVREIFDNHGGSIPGGLCIQHFNRYIKEICRKVGLTEKVSFTYTRGHNLVTTTTERCELVSSHTARRSAATNMYMTGRFKLFEIMSITGHTTEKAFFGYIGISSESAARQIAGDSYFRGSAPTLL